LNRDEIAGPKSVGDLVPAGQEAELGLAYAHHALGSRDRIRTAVRTDQGFVVQPRSKPAELRVSKTSPPLIADLARTFRKAANGSGADYVTAKKVRRPFAP